MAARTLASVGALPRRPRQLPNLRTRLPRFAGPSRAQTPQLHVCLTCSISSHPSHQLTEALTTSAAGPAVRPTHCRKIRFGDGSSPGGWMPAKAWTPVNGARQTGRLMSNSSRSSLKHRIKRGLDPRGRTNGARSAHERFAAGKAPRSRVGELAPRWLRLLRSPEALANRLRGRSPI